ncbi:MAG: hypothetical protein K8E24_015695, partial [Methanobacterium paludis]|nr:hypothetical protein [Methanobacterium paludis]
MPDQALIGPISLPNAQLLDGDSYAEDGEKLSLYGTEALIRQIRGITGNIQKAQYGSMKILSSDSPWGPIWIDGSVNLKNNDNITHRGWYFLGTAEPKIEAPGIASLDANLELIAVDPHEILDIEYTPGINDDTDLDNNYPKLVQNTLFADTFDNFDQVNNWDGPANSLMTTHSVAASGGKMVFTGASDVDGKWGSEWIKTTPTVDGHNNLITVETDMEWVAKPTSGNNQHRMYFWISNKASTSSVNWKGAVLLMLAVESNRISYRAQVIKQDGTVVTVVPLTATTAQIIKWKFEETVGGYFNLYVAECADEDDDAEYVKKVSHMWTDIQPNWKGLYFMYGFWNMDSTSASMKSSFLNVYSWTNGINNNIITGPVGATLGLPPTGTRTGEDGAIPYWVNPNSRITLQTTPANFYNGSVKAYNSNYADGTPRLITNQHDILDRSVSTDEIADKAVTPAKMSGSTAGNLLFAQGTTVSPLYHALTGFFSIDKDGKITPKTGTGAGYTIALVTTAFGDPAT